jgi:hypothetical protein
MSDDIRTKVRAALKSVDSVRTAAEMPFPDPKSGNNPSGQNLPQPGNQTRNIPKGHKFDPKSLKPLARMMWAMSVGLGHTLQAYRTFNRVKSSSISPDGMLGGRGYVMKVSDLRQRLYDACEALSLVSDTIHDELNAPHWKPKLAELDKEEFDQIDRLLGESEENLDNPEEDAEEGAEEAEKTGKPSKNWPPTEEETSSEMPTGGSPDVVQKVKPKGTKTASTNRDLIQAILRRSSTIPMDPLSGPRIDDLAPGDSDQVEDYPEKWADSGLPTDDKPSEGLDFGLGYGAEGEGFDPPPDPHAGLPDGLTADAALPGDGISPPTEINNDLMGVGYRYARNF